MAITKKDLKFLRIIDEMEPKAHCLRAKIACILVKNGKILSKGTNNWHKEANCSKIGCIRKIRRVKSGTRREVCYGLCAEQWALARAAKEGISVNGSTCYSTKHPCRVCESLLKESGIKRIVYQEGYPDQLPNYDLLRRAKIKVEKGPNTDKKVIHELSKYHSI